ncbi:hypothetical protein Tco_0879657 [Tanacetum coccineum]
MLWERRGIANMAFIQLGGVSRVDEMILARERSGFAGKKYGATYKFVPTESYKDAWLEMKQQKFFYNVIADHPEDIMASPPQQGNSPRLGFTSHISFAKHGKLF